MHIVWGNGTAARGPRHRRWPPAFKPLAAALVAAQIAVGCAEYEHEWQPLMYLHAEIADGLAETYCSVRLLFSPASQSSEFAARADPKLLELARRDARRACLKGLEARGEERARRLPGRNNI